MAVELSAPIWLYGCGNMAGAMLQGWLAAGADPSRFTAIRPSGKDVAPGVRVLTAMPQDEVPALVLLGVKPQKLAEVAPALAPVLAPETVLVSILAGVEIATLRSAFPSPRSIVRAMPNLPVALGKGVTGLCADGLDGEGREGLTNLMATLGLVEWVGEAQMDLFAALAGSGPAFLYRFIDALGSAGAELGFSPDQSARLALSTVEGAAALAARSDVPPATLADRVASPGGSTRAGLNILDTPLGLRALLVDTLAAAVARNREMAAEVRGR